MSRARGCELISPGLGNQRLALPRGTLSQKNKALGCNSVKVIGLILVALKTKQNEPQLLRNDPEGILECICESSQD